MGEPRVTRGSLPANKCGNDPYDTGIGVEHYLALIEPVEEIETSADLANVVADQGVNVLFLGCNSSSRRQYPTYHVLRNSLVVLDLRGVVPQQSPGNLLGGCGSIIAQHLNQHYGLIDM